MAESCRDMLGGLFCEPRAVKCSELRGGAGQYRSRLWNAGQTEAVGCTDTGVSSEGVRVTWIWPPSFVLKGILKSMSFCPGLCWESKDPVALNLMSLGQGGSQDNRNCTRISQC